jgi:hypothetical protein
MNEMLITRPEHDDATTYLSEWSKEIVFKVATRASVSILDLNNGRATYKQFHSFIKTHSPRFVMFNGHGNEETIMGHNNEILVDENNVSDLKDKIVYSISCRSASRLGHICVAHGSPAFIGYKKDFILFVDNNSSARPLTDTLARPCMDAAMQVPVSIIKGNKTKEAYQRSQETFKKYILSFLGSRELEAPYILQSLIENMTNQVLIGNEDVTAW